ncbi:MAG: magnesium transporter CorA family protein [Chloroflexi bacterium]|nr:magnesium transporter CorA family protein [Chloroflexota bacterium]
MIRSLVAPSIIGENSLKENEEGLLIKRNLTRENLEVALNEETHVWLDLVDPDTDEIQWLQKVFKLHPVVVSDLLREDRRPTLVIYPDYMFLSLFQPQLSVGQVKGDEVHCLVGGKFFITVRKSSSATIEGVYNRIVQNEEAWRRGVIYFLYLVIQAVIDSYYPLLDRISIQLFELEEKTLSNGEGKIAQKSVYRIKQQLIALRQMISPQREVLSNVIGEQRVSQSASNRDLFAHLYERLLRIYDVIDAQRDLSNNVLDLLQNQESARLTEAVNRLTVISIIFLPLTFLVGLFSLNFITTKPELAIPLPGWAFFILLTFITLLSGMLLAWFFRRKGWL